MLNMRAQTAAAQERATPLRVALCVDNLLPCGAQQVVKHLAIHLDADRYEAIVYAFQDGPLRRSIEEKGHCVRVIERHIPKIDPGLVRRLRKAFSADRISLLHTHLFGASLHAILAARTLPLAGRVITLHADREDNSLQRLAWPMVFSRADKIVAVSRDTASGMGARHAVLEGKLVTIPNGIDMGPFRTPPTKMEARMRLNLPMDCPLLGTVGRLTAQKDHKVLIEAFAEIARRVPAARLLIVGDGELRAQLVAQCTGLGIGDAVCFLGSRNDVPDILAALDVFVLSSLWEGLPLVLLEAMATGTPVVTTAVGGIEEVVTDGREAVVVPPGDPSALAKGMLRLLEHAGAARVLAERARARVGVEHSVQRMAREHDALYAGLVSRPAIKG